MLGNFSEIKALFSLSDFNIYLVQILSKSVFSIVIKWQSSKVKAEYFLKSFLTISHSSKYFPVV